VTGGSLDSEFHAPSRYNPDLLLSVPAMSVETDQDFRGIKLKALDDAIFSRTGQLKILGHGHSPVPAAP
jgi:hypothetical protein